MKKIIRISLCFLFLLGFSWVSAKLFFEKQTDQLMTSVADSIFGDKGEIKTELDELKVVYYDEAISLEPMYTDPAIWKRLINIYEPLVRPDRDLKLKPALAISWGLVDDRTWSFSLRKGVKFHDGSDFNADDVLATFNRAFAFGRLKNIDEIKKIDEFNIAIITKKPDPLLLQRLSRVFIVPAEYEDTDTLLDSAVGTGPYKFLSWKENSKMVLQRFNDYWGNLPKFKEVEIIFEPDKSRRVGMLLNDGADLLDFVPYDAVDVLEDRDFEIEKIPSLQVEFLLFNFHSAFAGKRENRQVVSLLIDLNFLDRAFGDYVRKVNQFVSNGTFGFSPEIKDHEYDFAKAQKMVDEVGIKGQLIQVHLPIGMEYLGEYIRQQLSSAGLAPVVSYLENDRLLESMSNGKADIYFLGFRAELGDSADFLEVVPHSEGNFNLTKYFNKTFDTLVDKAAIEMDQDKRLKILQESMKLLVEDDVFGIPLIEYETLYTFSDRIQLIPRIDGFIYFDELKIK